MQPTSLSLQMLNSHIKKKKVGNASSPITDTSSESFVIRDDSDDNDSFHWIFLQTSWEILIAFRLNCNQWLQVWYNDQLEHK